MRIILADHQRDREPRAQVPHSLGQLAAVHPWHGEIGEHETHHTGLHPRATWLRLLTEVGFDATAETEHTTEDRQPRTIFVAHRRGG